jgi:hypothetical protein
MITNIESMVGHTVKAYQREPDTLTFEMENGQTCRFYHEQDCCESVSIESVTGDFDVLIGSPLTFVDEQVSNEDPPDAVRGKDEYIDESYTWTTYTFRTEKGEAKIRWYGSSNGYYSESVNFAVMK